MKTFFKRIIVTTVLLVMFSICTPCLSAKAECYHYNTYLMYFDTLSDEFVDRVITYIPGRYSVLVTEYYRTPVIYLIKCAECPHTLGDTIIYNYYSISFYDCPCCY